MATPNKSIIEKANLEVSDLIANGGYLQAEQAVSFVQKMIVEAKMMKAVTVQSLASHTKLIDKIGISGRVLRAASSGRALAEADRVKPTTEQVELHTKLMKGELRLSDETLEDNIEAGTFKTTVMDMMAKHVAKDMDELIISGDDDSSDLFLRQMDGMLKSASAHVVNGGTLPINKSTLKAMVKAMPKAYDNETGMQFFTSRNAVVDFKDSLSDRNTALGDAFLLRNQPVTYYDRPINAVPMFPDDLGVGSNETNMLYLDPKNWVWGIWRKIRVESDRDITTGEWVMVVSLRAGGVFAESDAVVKAEHIKTA